MLADYFGSKNSEKQDADQDEEKHGTEGIIHTFR